MKILIVDDHTLFREGLSHILLQLGEDLETIEANSYEAAIAALSSDSEFDLMLLDLNMPGKDGFSVLKIVGKNYPTLPVAVLSASLNKSDLDRVLATSAMGYIPKDTSSEVMLCAVKLILSGGIYTPPTNKFTNHPAVDTKLQDLTPRQFQVLTMLVSGDANKKIATKLCVSEATIKMHVTSIFKSLGVSNRTQATLAAIEMGYRPAKS